MADDNLFQELGDRLSERKRLLFVVACWRDAWDLIPNDKQRQAVRDLETSAEMSSCKSEVVLNQLEIENKLWDRVWSQQGSFQSQPPWDEATAVAAATILVTSAALESPSDSGHAWTEADRARDHAGGLGLLQVWDSRIAKQAAILRHLVGNPFRPYAFPANWSTPVIQLADAVYNGQPCAFALRSLLEAGHPDIADHFREAEHPKGCWVLDAILDKK